MIPSKSFHHIIVTCFRGQTMLKKISLGILFDVNYLVRFATTMMAG